ncbi:MAG: PDZ domain-containing protein [Alistipes sp.]|nr:PDZ domain-containing protein [Alistipes sp.]
MSRVKRAIKYVVTAVGMVAAAGVFTFASRDDFGLGRNMELLVNMMRELATHYVDKLDPDKMMRDAANGMVGNLDPYTAYLSEEDMKEFELATTGKYGGIGALIRKRGDYIVIAEPYKGSPADRAGLKAGDKIVAIGGDDAKGFTTEQVSSRLKGDPNTNVKVTIENLFDGKRRTLNIRRERIAIPGIAYAGMLNDSVGYVRHADFTDGCYDDMRAAIERLCAEQELKGLVLDYRNNGGGILQEAVKIVSLFTPKGTEVVSTKGRVESENKTFRTELDPLLPDVPIVVLVNGNTASSSEIVAGALQDMDRAVIMGQKSFGKGLVQSSRPIGYDAYVKMTTAKYYIPSGRCIQNIDYSEHRESGREVADSLIREFKTRNGRKVYDGGGIMPDVSLDAEYISRFALTLYAMGIIDEFGDEYMKRHHADTIDVRRFSISDEEYERFVEFVKERNVAYTSETRLALDQLRRAVKADRFEQDMEKHIADIESGLKDDTESNLRTYRDEIVESLNSHIVLRYKYSEGAVEHSLVEDKEVAEAVKLLGNLSEYHEILSSRDTRRK